MKKATTFIGIVVLMSVSLTAQTIVGKYKDWKKIIDLLEVKKSYDLSGRKTVYILPVDVSEVELPDEDSDNYPIVTKELGDLANSVAATVQRELQKDGYTVKVAESADFRDKDAIVISLGWKEFDLGSRALRAWVGFGAGNASFSTKGVVYDGDEEIITFSHKKICPMDTRKYDALAKKGIKEVSVDLAKMVKNL